MRIPGERVVVVTSYILSKFTLVAFTCCIEIGCMVGEAKFEATHGKSNNCNSVGKLFHSVIRGHQV